MNKSKTLIMAFLFAGSFIAAGSPAANAETTLVLNNFFPLKSPFVRGLIKPWVANVQKNSGGRITVKIPAASLAPPPRQWDMLTKGVADVAITANGFQRQRLKLPEISTIPFITPTATSAAVALWRTQQKFFNAANEYKGVKLLAQFTLGSGNIQSTKKPILKSADLKGMKIRTQPGIQKAVMQALGATAVTAPGVKTFEFISGGIVDGSFSVVDAAFLLKYGRYLNSITEFPGGLNKTPFSFFMNQKTWEGLSAADKKAVEQASGEPASRRVGKAFDGIGKIARRGLEKEGVKFIKASPAFIAEAKEKLGFVEKKWLAAAKERGIDGPAAMAYYLENVAKVMAGK